MKRKKTFWGTNAGRPCALGESWAEVGKYKVSKHRYISLLPSPQHPRDQRSTYAEHLTMIGLPHDEVHDRGSSSLFPPLIHNPFCDATEAQKSRAEAAKVRATIL